ncbi:MAG: hypothetical protein WCJ04_07735 [Actinomycetes bacterium]
MRMHLRKTLPLLFGALLLVAIAPACSTEDVESTTSTTFGPSAETVKIEMPSVAKTLHKVGKDDTITYGANQLVGPATVLGQPASVEILGSVNYISGSGPFTGFLTVTWADGSSVGFSILGQAKQSTDGSSTIDSAMTYIGGSGSYVDSKLVGEFSGSRTAVVGTPITIELTLEVLS